MDKPAPIWEGSDPKEVYLEVSPILFNRACSEGRVPRITARVFHLYCYRVLEFQKKVQCIGNN